MQRVIKEINLSCSTQNVMIEEVKRGGGQSEGITVLRKGTSCVVSTSTRSFHIRYF